MKKPPRDRVKKRPAQEEARFTINRRPHGRFSWNTHALLTRAALSTATIRGLQEPVIIAPLSDFLAACGKEIQTLVRWHRELLAAKSGRRQASEEICSPVSDAAFLELIHLNPAFTFSHVRLALPEQISPDHGHNPSRQGPNDLQDAGAPESLYIETPGAGELTAWDVLFTFSDEPDWGLDQDLYVLDGQPYGEAPFGIRTGPSSQGPFHMAFFHENRLLYLLLPPLRRSFVEERCRLSFGLADLAFRVGVPYWGWRFGAWAVHYLQDVTQPYHARAFPPSLLSVLWRFPAWGSPSGLGTLVRDTLKSRHFLFEGFLHFLLNEAVKRGTFPELASALSGSEDLREQPLENVLRVSSRRAAALARKADRSLGLLLGNLSLPQVEGFLSEENSSGIVEEFQDAMRRHPDSFRQFMMCVCPCLKDAGTVTRYALARIREASRGV